MKRAFLLLSLIAINTADCAALELVDAYTGEPDEITADAVWWQDVTEYDRKGASDDELLDRVLLRMAATDDAVCDVQHTGIGEKRRISIRRGYYEQMIVDGPSQAVNQALASQLKPVQGEIIRKSELSELLAWLHRNPFHAVAPTFVPSGIEGGVESVWQVAPVRRWRAVLGANNQGVAPLSRERFFLNASLADLGGLNSVLSVQWTAAADPHEFSSLRIDSVYYLPWRHEWRTSFAWTGISFLDDCSCEIPQQIDGQTWQASGKYVIPLDDWIGWKQDFHAAVYFRSTDNALEAGDTISTGLVDSFFLSVGWNLQKKSQRSDTRIATELLVSPGDVGGNNDQNDHETFRAEAENDYVMLRASAQHMRALPNDRKLAFYTTTQIASAPVLPHDQMALGGMYGVRGLRENALLGDQVIRYGMELRSESWQVLNTGSKIAASLYVDGGFARDMAEHAHRSAHSVGIGLHLVSAQNLAVEISQGWTFTEEHAWYASVHWSF